MELSLLVSERQIKPGVVKMFQFENGTTSLRFTLDSYMHDQTDLRNYKAYVITSINGHIDMTEIPSSFDGEYLTLTWVIQEFSLRHVGAMHYQIVFKENDSDGDNSAVYYTYKGVLQVRESIDSDNQILARYPTILQQNQNLIQSLSGMFGSEIVYMPVGQSIPVEERLIGRLYYQWLEAPATRATSATATINLGSRPYADSGLYINGTHVCLYPGDNWYAVSPSAWVEHINYVDCGVVATDISQGEDIIIQLTASEEGSVGNSIEVKFDVATYGAGKGVINPSNGTVSSSHLVGGFDEQRGVTNPTGRFEDAFGNILGLGRATHLTNPDLNALREHGEYICVGGRIDNLPSDVTDKTYFIVRVTDTNSTSRVLQECYCVNIGDNTVRTFVRALTDDIDAGEWREQVTDEDIAKVYERFDEVDERFDGVDEQITIIKKDIVIPFMPDYASRVELGKGSTIVPVDAVGFAFQRNAEDVNLNIKVWGIQVYYSQTSSHYIYSCAHFYIPAGAEVEVSGSSPIAGNVFYAPLVKTPLPPVNFVSKITTQEG